MIIKPKHFLLMGICIGLASSPVFAQVKPHLDTIPARDSVLDQLKDNLQENIPVVSIDENDGDDGGSQNVSSLLSAGRDPYLNAATFKFSAVRFRLRGYDADQFSTYINGAPMENLDNGFTPYSQWGGLNDVLRNRDNSMGLAPSLTAFGGFGGVATFDTRASHQRRQTSINYAVSNRSYAHRLMLTHSTGLNRKGWAFSFSASRRWADEGYTDGTFYDGWSFFAAVDKRISDRQLLSLSIFATPTTTGRQGATVQEMRDISGDNFYNPYWGYQNGRKRNANISKSFQPVAVLTHDLKINDKTSLVTAASFTYGERTTTGLDWYNVQDPRPDYYRYLPSYVLDPDMAEALRQEMMSDVNMRQINWDRLYQTNYGSYETINNVNGIEGNTVSGLRSRYIVEDRSILTQKFSFNSTINSTVSNHVMLTAGVSYRSQNDNYFKRVNDLLGGEFYVDINQFAERDFPSNNNAIQNDLNSPNRILHEGDKFGYNYDLNIKQGAIWAQGTLKFSRFDAFLSTQHSFTSFFRRGHVRTGLFPENSFGKSKTYNFYNSAVKGGVTYKIDGRNYVFARGGYESRAPFFGNAFIAPRTRDFVQDDLRSEEILSTEVGYAMNAPKLKIRANGYYTEFKHGLDVLTFYHDDYRNFVNYAISNIGKVHMGIELGAEAKIYKGISINAAANIGKYYYNTRQNATVTVDNSSELLSKDDVVYSNNFYVPTPQSAYTFGIDYRSPQYWFINVNFNYFDNMYLNYNPLRRTEGAVSGLEEGSAAWHNVVDQTKLDAQYTLDAFAGYSWLMNRRFKSMKKRTYLVFNVGVNNILNNTDIVTGGYEQLRFDFAEKNVNKFPDKRYYAYGTNFFASIGIRF